MAQARRELGDGVCSRVRGSRRPPADSAADKTGMANAEPITKYGITMRVLRPRSAYLPEIADSPLYTVSLVLCCHSHFIEVLIIPFGRDP